MRLQGFRRRLFNLGRDVVEQRRLSRRPRVLKMDGLRQSVEVITDTWGVPHITAKNTDDLFFAQGYVTARDRLFQLDYNRHGASGRLCELLGKRELPWRQLTVHLKECTTFDVDVMVRTFGLQRAAEQSLALHSSEARQILSAYTAGVNAYIATGARSIEHRLLGHTPKPWTEADCLLMIKAIGFELNFSWRSILLGALFQEAGVPDDVARVLWPHFPADGQTVIQGPEWRTLTAELVAMRQAAEVAIGVGNAPGVGSNSYAVAGSHTASGEALLANDTHLVLTTPVPWHEVRLLGAEWDLHGFALAGVPGVGIGRTPHISWGITAGLVQDLDLFVERLHPDDAERYLTSEGWRSLFAREETFNIHKEEPVTRTIYESHHGPLLETIATKPADVDGKHEGQLRLAIAWTAHRPGRDFDGLLGIFRARDFESFREATRHHVCPTFNMTYADATGRVGYVLAGVLPKRRGGTPLRPLEGWTGEWDWQGMVPFDENPYMVDPACGFVVTANNRIVPHDYPHELGSLFEPPERFERITERLQALGKKVTPEDMASIQLDYYSAWAVRSRDKLLSLVGGVEGLVGQPHSLQRRAADLWCSWDGMATAQSAGAAIAMMTAFNTGREVVRRLAGDDAAFGFLEMASFVCEPILRLADLRERFLELGVDLGAVVRWSFERTVEQCRQSMGEEPEQWQWGQMHPVLCKHRLNSSPLGPLLSIGPEPAGGGPDTVNRGDIDGSNSFGLKVAAALRMVVSAAERDRAATILPGGQSGDRLSRHYDDQMPLFLAGDLKPARISRDSIEHGFREELWPNKGEE